MDGTMEENQSTIVEKYEHDKPLIQKIDSKIDNWYRDCHNNYFHKFEYKCLQDSKITIISNNGIVIITIADKSMNLYELNKKLKIPRKMAFYSVK